MKILILSDAWTPQINGVVRTLAETAHALEQAGHVVHVIGPDHRRLFSFAAPFYPEITLEFFAHGRLVKIVHKMEPDCIHIATEGPLGWAARRLCLEQNRPFTSSYHTRFPDYLAVRAPRGLKGLVWFLTYVVLRHFHGPSAAVMVPTASIENELRAHKFHRLVRWSRGVDTDLFRPYEKPLPTYDKWPRPLLLYVGRLAIEKNIRAFLNLNTAGSLVVIGDGPDCDALKREYPSVHFLGKLEGETLARHYAAADLFVFPSTTDTFGLVLLEACAAGLRVAAFPAPGPSDIFAKPECQRFAVLDANLQRAVDKALMLPDTPEVPRQFSMNFSWTASTEQFLEHLITPPEKQEATPCENDHEKAI